MATKRNFATRRCEPLASKQTLGPAAGEWLPLRRKGSLTRLKLET